MHNLEPSFFDNQQQTKPPKKIWNKPEKNKAALENLVPQLRHEFLKMTKKKFKSKSRMFIIEGENLYYFKSASKKKVSGYLSLTQAKVSWKQISDGSLVFKGIDSAIFGFRITSNMK